MTREMEGGGVEAGQVAVGGDTREGRGLTATWGGGVAVAIKYLREAWTCGHVGPGTCGGIWGGMSGG